MRLPARLVTLTFALALFAALPSAADDEARMKAALDPTAVPQLESDGPPPVAEMNEARIFPEAVRLSDGRVFVSGGRDGSAQGIASTEIYDPNTGRWSPASPMRIARSHFGATLLRNGRILVAGGWDSSVVLKSAELFNPKTGQWTDAASMRDPRNGFVLTRLADGRVLAAGGVGVTTAEIYDPKTDRWAPTPHLRAGSSSLLTNRLHDGRVLMTDNAWPASAMIYDPRKNSMTPVLPAARVHESGNSVTLLDGRVLVAGGLDKADPNLTETYDPARGYWTPSGRLTDSRVHFALVRAGRRVVAAGGLQGLSATASVEIFDPAMNAWTRGPWMKTPRAHFSAIALDKTHVLVIGGEAPAIPQGHALKNSEIIDLDGAIGTPPSEPLITQAPRPAYFRRPAPRYPRLAPEHPHDFAIVIGVGHYEHLPPADFAEDDAYFAVSLLTALGVPQENVVPLVGSHAKLTEVLKYLEEWLPKRVSPDSLVYFFYSGHGAPDVKDGTPYLMPWDADVSFVKSTALPLDRLYGALGKLAVKDVIVFLDACFSGAGGRSVLPQGTRPLVNVRAPTHLPPKISVLAAAAYNEIAGTSEEHGLLSLYLLRGLLGDADPRNPAMTGHVTLEQLHAYVRRHVILDARKQNREQTPTLTSPNPSLKLY